MRQFMQALFQAVKSESASSSTSTNGTSTTSSADPKTSFASSLSALISQVGNGQAPADLQSAFSKLATDLQGTSGSSTSSTSGTTTSGATTSQSAFTLQTLLSQMQQNLGYGASGSSTSSSASSLGNLVSTLA
jgi:cytoskeletal protein RodZ